MKAPAPDPTDMERVRLRIGRELAVAARVGREPRFEAEDIRLLLLGVLTVLAENRQLKKAVSIGSVRDSDGSPQGGDGSPAPSRSDDSAGRQASPTPPLASQGGDDGD